MGNRQFAHCGKTHKEGRTLLFIDEIQNSPKAVAQLRYFYEELPEILEKEENPLPENNEK